MRVLVDENSSFVARVLRKAGVPQSELDDLIQRTFISVAQRLDDIHCGAERRFMFRVAVHNAAHARRTRARRREDLTCGSPPEGIEKLGTPEYLVQRKQMHEALERIIDCVPRDLRVVLLLHAAEEKSTGEIAALLSLPRGTVASRLRRARAHVRGQASAVELAGEWGIERAHLAHDRADADERVVHRSEPDPRRPTTT
jgi:RNA polymerase sigma-70 factor (ECF subfamily)